MSGYVDDRLGRTQNIIEVRRLDYREGPLSALCVFLRRSVTALAIRSFKASVPMSTRSTRPARVGSVRWGSVCTPAGPQRPWFPKYW